MTASGDLLGQIDQPAPDPISEASSKGINAAVAAVMGAEGMVARKAERARVEDERARHAAAARRTQAAAEGSREAADQLRDGVSDARDSLGEHGKSGPPAPDQPSRRPDADPVRMSDGTVIHPPDRRPPFRFSDDVHAMKVWRAAVDTIPDADSSRAMSEAERYLSDTQPDLMRRYYTHLDAGRSPKEAMGLGLGEVNTPNHSGTARPHPGPDPKRHPRTPTANSGTHKAATPIKTNPTTTTGVETLTRSAS